MDAIVSFIESNPGISFLNLQLFFGCEIKTAGFTEDRIKTECATKYPDGSVQLGEHDQVDDYVVNIPSSVFDTATDFTVEGVKEICDKIALLREPIEIVLNEQVPNHAEFIDVPVNTFEIPVLTAAYDSIKSTKDTVSKVREMLADFQPQLLERKSYSILNQMCVGEVNIFDSISDFIKAFTDPKFFALYQEIVDTKPELIQIQFHGDVWFGSFGMIRFTIHVMHGRQGTGASNKINAGNVIQAALFYKDRKNDFIRSNSAISMIKHCSTQWPDGRSSKVGTQYTFSDLYTGEKIVQKYDGKQPDFASPEPFVSILQDYHVPSKTKPIYTNQEHIVAVYPASCIFRDDCYYETLVTNLQMISQKANSEVNAKEYESPLGKLQYVHDIHEKQKRDFVGKLYLTQMDLCTRAMLLTKNDELDAVFQKLIVTILDKEVELKKLQYTLSQEVHNIDIRLGQPRYTISEKPQGSVPIQIAITPAVTETDIKELRQKRQDLIATIENNILINLQHIADAKKMFVFDSSKKTTSEQYEGTKKMFFDLHNEMEYKTRKAILMDRLIKMQTCCLDIETPHGEAIVKHRRDIVLSCIDSVAIIIACAKIAVLTVTTTASAHQKLVKDTKELAYLRSLSLKLFHEYTSTKDKQTTAIDQLISMIHSQGKLMNAIQKQIIYSAVTQNELDISEMTRHREAIDKSILQQLIVRVLNGSEKRDAEDIKYELTAQRVDEINACDAELKRLTRLKNDLNGEFSYVLTHLYDIGQYISTDLFEIANEVNQKTLQLLNLLGTDQTPEFKECMKLLTQQESSHAPVSCDMVDIQNNREDVFDDVGIERTVRLVSEIFPQEKGIDVAVANEIAADILNGQPAADTIDVAIDEEWLLLEKRADDKINQRKRLSEDFKKMLSGIEVEKIRAKMTYRSALLERKRIVEGDASSSPQFSRWMGRLDKNDARKTKAAVQDLTREAEGIRSFMYFYVCNNPQLKPTEPTIRQISTFLNNDANKKERETHMSVLVKLLQQSSPPSGPRGTVGVGGGMAGGLEPHEIEEQMNEAIEQNNVVKMYDLYIEYFDTEETKDLTLLFYQVYSILSKRSIYVPLYRRHVTPLEELIHPVYVKRLDYTGDLHDFDCVYADNFCVQIFGKNVNELLDDLAKGKLTVPRGVFPNICENPFDPYSLICILEVCRFFCLFLPFAGRLQFYFAGVLSFMNQTYDVNMVQIQTDQILDYLNTPEFFQCFHAAARMYNERYNQDITPLVIDQPEPYQPELAQPELVQPEPDQPAQPAQPAQPYQPEPVQPVQLVQPDQPYQPEPVQPVQLVQPDQPPEPPIQPSNKLENLAPPAGGTRRYRRYKQKTKRQTLNKRFKRHRTRRLHGSHVRE